VEVCEIGKSSLKDQKKTLPVFPLKGNRIVNIQPCPQGLLFVQNGGRRNPWPRLPKWLQKFVRISSRKRDELSSFCLNNGFRLQKTNRAARPGNNLRKSQFIMCRVTKYSTIRGVFQQPSPTAILNEEKALGTRLVNISHLGKSLQSVIDHASVCSCDGNPCIEQEIERKGLGCVIQFRRDGCGINLAVGNSTQIKRSRWSDVTQHKHVSRVGFYGRCLWFGCSCRGYKHTYLMYRKKERIN